MSSETPPPNSSTPGPLSCTDRQRPVTPSSVPPSLMSPSSHQISLQQQQQQQQQEHEHIQQQPSAQNPNGAPQQFCLRWNNYQTNLTIVFDQLLQSESFVDVTLACDGHSMKAHKMVLSACSPYFQALFFDNPCQHPIIIMRDVKWPELKAIVEFMYKGEINVSQDQIGPLLRVAEMLKIRGLADVNGDQELNASPTTLQAPPIITPEIITKKSRISRDWGDLSNNSCTNGVNLNAMEAISTANISAAAVASTTLATATLTTTAASTSSTSSSSGSSSTTANSNNNNNNSNNINNNNNTNTQQPRHRKRRWPSGDNMSNPSASPVDMPTSPENLEPQSPIAPNSVASMSHPPSTPTPLPYPIPPPLESMGLTSLSLTHPDDMEIKPGIAEMIREEERAKLLENSHPWLGASTSSIAGGTTTYSHRLGLRVPHCHHQHHKHFNRKIIIVNSSTDSYQYQLQSMWQKCWNTNQNLIHHLRFRERGPLKSWRPETMAEAIFSVLKEGLSLSQAARKYDIPYPTFVLYANRVHNMLGPSIDGGTDLRPKGRGRPQRILLGVWADDHIKGVIKTVVFRDAKELKEDAINLGYGRHSPVFPFQDGPMGYPSGCSNGLGPQQTVSGAESMSPEAATAAAVAAVAHGIRQQMQMAAAAHHQDAGNLGFNLSAHCSGLTIHPSNNNSTGSIPMPKLGSPAASGQMSNSGGNGVSGMPIPRMGSPAIPGNNSGHGLHGMSGIAGLPQSHNLSSGSMGNSHHSQLTISSINSGIHISRLNSPHGSAHDLRMNSPDESPLHSPLELALEPAVNLAVGVSGMTYKPSRGYSSPRPEHLFQEDIADLVGTPRSCPSRLNSFKEPTSTIKLEPLSECRGE